MRKITGLIIPLAFVIMVLLGIILSATVGTFGSSFAQSNVTNQTGKTTVTTSTAPPATKQASQSIRGAITETGQFL